MTRLIRFNKPFDVLPQFTDRGSSDTQRQTLSSYIDCPGVYPAGRLDRDSEGLMLLTDDGRLQAWISDPRHKLEKTYWVQVEGTPDPSAISALCKGVELKDGLTRPAKARLIDMPPGLWARTPPIRVRKSVPDSWIELRIREGKNRQVRRMTAAVGHPTLRLIRAAIGAWTLDDLAQGKWEDLEPPRVPAPPKPSQKPPRHKLAKYRDTDPTRTAAGQPTRRQQGRNAAPGTAGADIPASGPDRRKPRNKPAGLSRNGKPHSPRKPGPNT